MAWCAARRITVLRESRSSSTLRARQLRQCKPASRRWVTRSRLRGQGLRRAVLGTAGFSAVAALVLGTKALSVVEPAVAWIIGGFGVFVVFWLARHFLRMAFQSIRRGILNQHVLLEFGALAGLVGGVLGLILRRPDYPTAQFFAVTVHIVNYHIFSEWLSLLVKTRSSQAVKRLLDLQPDTALVVRGARDRGRDRGGPGGRPRPRPPGRPRPCRRACDGRALRGRRVVRDWRADARRKDGGGRRHRWVYQWSRHRPDPGHSGRSGDIPAAGRPTRRGRARLEAGHPAPGGPHSPGLCPGGADPVAAFIHLVDGRHVVAHRATGPRACRVRRPECVGHGLSLRSRDRRATVHRPRRGRGGGPGDPHAHGRGLPGPPARPVHGPR